MRCHDSLPYLLTAFCRHTVCHIFESHRLDLYLKIYTIGDFIAQKVFDISMRLTHPDLLETIDLSSETLNERSQSISNLFHLIMQ